VIDPNTFRPVDVKVKNTTATAWIARPDNPYPARPPSGPPRSAKTRRIFAVTAAAAFVSAMSVFVADAPGVRGGDVRDLGIGRELPGDEEFLAYVVNLATDKCLSRNGAYTHPNDSDTPGQGIYQWDCAGSDNPGHVVLLAPVAGGWHIRSSVRADLCLAADGGPGDEQHYQRCRPGDDRQLWRLRRVRGKAPDTVVIENRDTGGCLAHQGGRPDQHIQIFQRDCRPLGHDDVSWSVEPYALPGRRPCGEPVRGPMRNHETGRYLADEDQSTSGEYRSASSVPVVSLVAAGESAHGCKVSIAGPSGTCLGGARAGTPVWSPCHEQDGGQWVVESRGDAGGRSWARLHSALDFGKCLVPDGGALSLRRCDGSSSQQWQLG
jgi:hypothetical protein